MKKGLFKKGLVLGIIILFVSAGVIPSIGGANIVRKEIQENKDFNVNFYHRGNILYVGGSGEGNYTTIQEAIDYANDSDTIFVYDDSSPYEEDLYIYKSIDLVGENKLTTEIKGYLGIDGFYVNISGFTINSYYFEIYASQITLKENIITNTYGIWIYDTNFCVISKNIIIKNSGGINFNSCSYCIISDNIIVNNSNSLSLGYCTDCIITGNTFLNNNGGLRLWSSKYNNITNNNFLNCKYSLELKYNSNNNYILNNSFFNDGLTITGSYQNIISNNLVNNKPILYFEDESDKIIDNEITGQIIIVSCNNISISNLELSNTSTGITILNSNECKINNNSICSNNLHGIYLTPDYYGNSTNNLIKGNTLKHNMESGIRLDNGNGNSENNIIMENNIMNNGDGININDYNDNYNSFTIINNKISFNNRYGLNIYGSYNNKIADNIISDNNNGLMLSYSYGNIFRNNTFEDNLNDFYVDGWEIFHYHQDIDTTNTIDGKKIYYLVEQTDLLIDESYNVGYISLISSNNITLKNLIIKNEIIGLLIVNTT